MTCIIGSLSDPVLVLGCFPKWRGWDQWQCDVLYGHLRFVLIVKRAQFCNMGCSWSRPHKLIYWKQFGFSKLFSDVLTSLSLSFPPLSLFLHTHSHCLLIFFFISAVLSLHLTIVFETSHSNAHVWESIKCVLFLKSLLRNVIKSKRPFTYFCFVMLCYA